MEIKENKQESIINISKKMFINALIILTLLIVVSSILTYVLPKGHFSETDGKIDFSNLIKDEEQKGLRIDKIVLSPILLLFSTDGINIIMLSIFLISVSGAFQVMSDTNGMHSIVYVLINKSKGRKILLIAVITLVFMLFGSLFGLFEETLALLPIIIYLSLSIGYDSYTGFLICTVATGMGFASAITNPFTVLYASRIIEADMTANIWYRIIIFLFMYILLMGFIMLHINKIQKDPKKSPTYLSDMSKKETMVNYEERYQKKAFITYVIFLLFVLISILTMTSIEALRSYTVVLLILVFLIGGIICGLIVSKSKKTALYSFGHGCKSALPAILLVILASCIKYILSEGKIIDTLANYIRLFLTNKQPSYTILGLFVIMLILEFFISSSTAKAIFVMGILKNMVTSGIIGISSNMIVLTYIFSDGYTNILFPTSPVLLIALSMVGISYSKWIKKSFIFFILTFISALVFLGIGLLIGY